MKNIHAVSGADVGRSTLYTFWDTLERYGIVKKTRRIGNTWLYRINADSPAVKALQEFQSRVIDIIVEEETKEKKEQPGLNVSELNIEEVMVSV